MNFCKFKTKSGSIYEIEKFDDTRWVVTCFSSHLKELSEGKEVAVTLVTPWPIEVGKPVDAFSHYETDDYDMVSRKGVYTSKVVEIIESR